MTEGPYYELLNRSDIRLDPTTSVVSEGVPLRLNMSVTSVVGDGTCAPLQGAVVDMWQCDAFGEYSDVSGNGQSDNTGKKYLRGYQVADADGQVSFVTVYPGWYQGRTVHIHFKVRETVDATQEFNSQLFFDEAVTEEVPAATVQRTRQPRSEQRHRRHLPVGNLNHAGVGGRWICRRLRSRGEPGLSGGGFGGRDLDDCDAAGRPDRREHEPAAGYEQSAARQHKRCAQPDDLAQYAAAERAY